MMFLICRIISNNYKRAVIVWASVLWLEARLFQEGVLKAYCVQALCSWLLNFHIPRLLPHPRPLSPPNFGHSLTISTMFYTFESPTIPYCFYHVNKLWLMSPSGV